MYNKHTGQKTEYQVIVENKICIGFNTKKKREDFIRRLNGTRKVTCITNVNYNHAWEVYI